MAASVNKNWKAGRTILPLAMFLGLLTGFVEGIGLFFLRQAHWLIFRLSERGVWYETFWVSPLVDLVLFSFVGIVFTLIEYFFPNKLIKRLAYPAFIFLAVFDWLIIVLDGRISLFPLLILAIGVSAQLTNMLIRFESEVLKTVHRFLPWLGGLVLILFMVIQGGSWLTEVIQTANLP